MLGIGIGPAFRLIITNPAVPVIDMVSVVTGLEAALGDNTKDCNALINAYINANTGLRSNAIWYFRPGTYYHKVDIYQLNLNNVAIIGSPGTVFQKLAGNNTQTREYVIFTTGSTNVYIDGIEFHGITTSLTAYGFGNGSTNADSGLYLASCDNTRVTNCRFYDFGDAAIRMTTSPSSENSQDSKNGYVQDNYFYNCTQVTTTPNGSISGGVGKGGCSNFNVIGNTAVNLKGSFKAACRYPTSGALFRDNNISCASGASSSCGIELLSYTNGQIINNTITGAANWALHCYPNGETGLNKFEYGNYTIDGNILQDNYRAIRINNGAYQGDGLQATPYNINLTRNTVDGTTYNSNSNPAAIVFSGGGWGSGQCKDNSMSNIANAVYATVQTNITASGNINA